MGLKVFAAQCGSVWAGYRVTPSGIVTIWGCIAGPASESATSLAPENVRRFLQDAVPLRKLLRSIDDDDRRMDLNDALSLAGNEMVADTAKVTR